MSFDNNQMLENKSEKTIDTLHSNDSNFESKECIVNKQTIVERLKDISADIENASKQEIDNLKQSFYKIVNAELSEAKRIFVEEGNEEEGFVAQKSDIEEEFKSILNEIKEKKKKILEQTEQEKEENYKKKLEIIEQIKAITSAAENSEISHNEFKSLQQRWNEITLIPQSKANELWKNYQLYVEQYYDLLKLNFEFREYDFKKNLELKLRLCDLAESLSKSDDVVSAFYQLQNLHNEFREIGPVSKECREEIWNRFKNASTEINKRYQNHFQELRQIEQSNLDKKTALCEIVEDIDLSEIKTISEWENRSKEIALLQSKWREIGFAPKKQNTAIYERFRLACSKFFAAKSEYFKTMKSEIANNLNIKEQLCKKAEELKESTDWVNTTNTLVKLQAEWKKVGYAGRKHSDEIWNRFSSACDYFFEQKAKANSDRLSIETDNLKKKEAIIEELEKTIAQGLEENQLLQKVKSYVSEWNKVGYVPIKYKDKIYKKFNSIVNDVYDKLHISNANKKIDSFIETISSKKEEGRNSLYKERERLMKIYNNIKSEITTYENNLGFLSSGSKKANGLINELNRKLENLKSDFEVIQKKISLLDEELSK